MGRVDDYFRAILANGWNTWESEKKPLTKDGKGVMIETDDEERWITIGAVPPSKKRDRRTGETVNVPGRKGKHVKIDENGNIVAGLGGKFGNLNEIGMKGKGPNGSKGPAKSNPNPNLPVVYSGGLPTAKQTPPASSESPAAGSSSAGKPAKKKSPAKTKTSKAPAKKKAPVKLIHYHKGLFEAKVGGKKYAVRYDDNSGMVIVAKGFGFTDQKGSFYINKPDCYYSTEDEKEKEAVRRIKEAFEEREKLSGIERKLSDQGVDRLEVSPLKEKKTTDQIVKSISGPDQTSGSCSSVAFAYVAQKFGLDVLDFRGGKSLSYFSGKQNKIDVYNQIGVKYNMEKTYSSNYENAREALKKMEKGKEYYFSVGRHAAIVRIGDNGPEFMELQKAEADCGWRPLPDDRLKTRFGCTSKSLYNKHMAIIGLTTSTEKDKISDYAVFVDIDQFKGNDGFKSVLEYINTKEEKQKKGIGGYAK